MNQKKESLEKTFINVEDAKEEAVLFEVMACFIVDNALERRQINQDLKNIPNQYQQIMKHDLLADMFCIIKNTEVMGRNECEVPASNLVKNVLAVMQKHNYIKKFTYIEDGRGGKINIQLTGKINDTNVIKPRFSVKIDEFSKFEKRYLPASGLGILILSTSKGVFDQIEAKKQKIGGKLLGFVYQ